MTQDQYYALFPNVEAAKAHEAFIRDSQSPFPADVDYYDFLADEHVRISKLVTDALRVGPNREFGTVGQDGRQRRAIRSEVMGTTVTKRCAVNFEMDVEARCLEFDCGEHITTCVAILIGKAMRLDQPWSTTINTVEITATPTSNLQKLVAAYLRALATRSAKAEEQDQ